MYTLSIVLALAVAVAHAAPLGLAKPEVDVPDAGKSPLNAAASYQLHRSLYAIQIDELAKAKLEFESALDGFTDSQRTDLSNRLHTIRELVTEYKEKIIEASGESVTGGGLVAEDEGKDKEGKLHAFATRPRAPLNVVVQGDPADGKGKDEDEILATRPRAPLNVVVQDDPIKDGEDKVRVRRNAKPESGLQPGYGNADVDAVGTTEADKKPMATDEGGKPESDKEPEKIPAERPRAPLVVEVVDDDKAGKDGKAGKEEQPETGRQSPVMQNPSIVSDAIDAADADTDTAPCKKDDPLCVRRRRQGAAMANALANAFTEKHELTEGEKAELEFIEKKDELARHPDTSFCKMPYDPRPQCHVSNRPCKSEDRRCAHRRRRQALINAVTEAKKHTKE